jgi:WD40 repeat protein
MPIIMKQSSHPLIIGSVSNDYSNHLDILVADLKDAHCWNYNKDEDQYKNYQNLNISNVKLGSSTGYLFEVGGCGTAKIVQISKNEFVIPEHYLDNWNDEIEADFFNKLLNTKTKKNIKKITTINITSGIISLSCPFDNVPKYNTKKIETVIKEGVAKLEGSGLIIPVPNGEYDIWTEEISIKGKWGIIERRIRIIPKGTKVKPGEPLKKIDFKPYKPKGSKTKGIVFIGPKSMKKVRSLDVDSKNNYIAAGEEGGGHYVVWDMNGKIVMEGNLFKKEQEETAEYNLMVFVKFHPIYPWFYVAYTHELLKYELPSGKLLEKINFKNDLEKGYLNGLFIFPDGNKVILTGHNICLFDAKKLYKISTINIPTQGHLALAKNGEIMATKGWRLKIFETKKYKEIDCISRKDPKDPTSVSDLTYSPDDNMLCYTLTNGTIEIYNTKNKKIIKILKDTNKFNHESSAVCWHPDGKRIAEASKNGSIYIWDIKKDKIIQEFPNHDNTIPGTGSRTLYAIKFTSNGSKLIVSASTKDQKGHITIYDI